MYFSLDLYEQDGWYFVEACLPGVGVDNVELEHHGTHLRIVVSHPNGAPPAERIYHRREQRLGDHSRELPLPLDAQLRDAAATLEHGLLVVQIPRMPKPDPGSGSILILDRGPLAGRPFPGSVPAAQPGEPER